MKFLILGECKNFIFVHFGGLFVPLSMAEYIEHLKKRSISRSSSSISSCSCSSSSSTSSSNSSSSIPDVLYAHQFFVGIC